MKARAPRIELEALRQSEERFRLLVQDVTDYAIFLLDADGRITSWNAGAERIKGYTREEALGTHFSRFYPQEALDRGWPEHELAVAGREGRFEDEGWRLRKDGSRFWANVVITALRDGAGRVSGFLKITRDLTDRRAHEEALRQSEERFRLLVEGVADYAIFMLDPDGRVATWNVGAARIKGYRADEIVGQHFSCFYLPEDAARGWPQHLLSLARRHGRAEDEGWRLRSDGSRFWASVVLTALKDADGELSGFAKLTRDLTERRRVEALEQEDQRRNEFLAMLGHELRNPLASIRNATAILERGVDPEEVAWAREVVERQAGHLERIVSDLLDVGRITTGRIQLRAEPMDLALAVEDAVASHHEVFAGKGQILESEVPDEPVAIEGDRTRIQQVVANLLTNAHKYTPRGGHVRVVLEREGAVAQLRVIDDGAGLSPSLLHRVFDLFVQGERTLDRADGGLGIGLTLVRNVVELHRGTVSATSAGLDRGSEFVVRLPLVDAALLRSGDVDSPAGSAREGRILVVDDNDDALQTLAMLVSLWGHDVQTAHDGPSALAAVAEHDPDVVLLDIGLPGMSGYEVASALRGQRCAVVAITGYGQRADVERSRAAGCAAHLVKPVDPEALEPLIAGLLTRE